MRQLQFLIPIVLVIISLLLIKYDRNKDLKNKHVEWISRNIFKNDTNMTDSIVRLHQTILSFAFIFCIGIALLFIIGIIQG